jgi:hypothetical protein
MAEIRSRPVVALPPGGGPASSLPVVGMARVAVIDAADAVIVIRSLLVCARARLERVCYTAAEKGYGCNIEATAAFPGKT